MSGDRDMNVAEILGKDRERQIEGVDIEDDIDRSLDHLIVKAEKGQKPGENGDVHTEARGNEG